MTLSMRQNGIENGKTPPEKKRLKKAVNREHYFRRGILLLAFSGVLSHLLASCRNQFNHAPELNRVSGSAFILHASPSGLPLATDAFFGVDR